MSQENAEIVRKPLRVRERSNERSTSGSFCASLG
jgi:hypothetical protein